MNNAANSTEVTGWSMMYDWSIKDFRRLRQKAGEFLYSPYFYAGSTEGQWRLEFYPLGDENSKCVSLYLHFYPSNHLAVDVYVDFSILTSKKVLAHKEFDHHFDGLEGKGFPELVRRSDLMDAAKNDSFIIRCKIHSIPPPIDKSLNVYKNKLGDDLRTLLEEPKFSDVAIIVEDETFRAHKNVLTARSPVFAAMFEHEQVIENVKNEVKIEDIEPVVVRAMLEFIYTGHVEDLDLSATELFVAANKYQLVDLENMCKEMLKEILDIENAIEILTLADFYDIYDLKQMTMDFVKINFSTISKTEDFEQMNNCALLKELMCFIAG